MCLSGESHRTYYQCLIRNLVRTSMQEPGGCGRTRTPLEVDKQSDLGQDVPLFLEGAGSSVFYHIRVNICFLPRKLRVMLRIQLCKDVLSNWLCPTLSAC